MILKKNGLTRKLRTEIPGFSSAVKKTPDRGVGSAGLSRTKPPSVFAGESSLTTPASMYDGTCSSGGTYRLPQENPLVHKPTERNSRLNKTAKAANFFFTRDIKN